MLGTIPEEKENGSCQLAFEKAAGIIQTGNKIIANIGVQMLHNWYRAEPNMAEFNHRF